MAGTISAFNGFAQLGLRVSMESGLDGRNNPSRCHTDGVGPGVSMESGLDGRNNVTS